MNFTGDSRKAQNNLRKHRVSFSEATSIFGDPLAATVTDPDHSFTESQNLETRRRLSAWLCGLFWV